MITLKKKLKVTEQIASCKYQRSKDVKTCTSHVNLFIVHEQLCFDQVISFVQFEDKNTEINRRNESHCFNFLFPFGDISILWTLAGVLALVLAFFKCS